MTSKPVYIVLLSYKNNLDTVECIKSLLLSNYNNFKILIVENSEDDRFYNDLAVKIKESRLNTDYIFINERNLSLRLDHQLIFIRSNSNKGFSAGNNIALKYILNKLDLNSFIWILNNDTVVLDSTLTNLVSYYENLLNQGTKLGVLGSKLLYYDKPNNIQAIGGQFINSLYICKHIVNENNKDNIDYIVGASMFVSTNFVQDVGLLPEDYFLYFEELDWIYLSRKKGYSIDYCSKAIVYHKEGATIGSSSIGDKSEFSEIELFKSRKKFIQKYYALNFTYYFSTLLLLINRIRKGKFSLVKKLIKVV